MDINRVIEPTDYDIISLVADCISHGIDIATQETEKEWKMLAHAFKVMGIDEASFVAASRLHGDATEKESRAAYKNAKRNYLTQTAAAQKILYFARRSGVKIWDYLPEAKQAEAKAAWREAERTETTRRTHRALSILRGQTPPAPVESKPQQEQTPKEYLSPGLIAQVESLTEQTTLYKFLLAEFGGDIKNTLAAYHVGGCKWYEQPHGLTTAFPLIDIAGNIHDFQLSAFDPNGHGSKYPSGDKVKNWALARMGKSESRAGMCFFGEHLLTERPAAPVAICEAPKTAIIAAACYPGFVWLACLSLLWLNSAVNCEPLRGREIWLFPDRDGLQLWQDKAAELRKAGYNVGVSDYLEQNPGEPKDDLADIVLRFRHGEQNAPPPPRQEQRLSPDRAEAVALWEQMKQAHPELQELEDKFDLEPISVEPYRCQNENE